ncbi:MAG: 4-coumarate--CoA ligase [Pseudomonadota bacterium]
MDKAAAFSGLSRDAILRILRSLIHASLTTPGSVAPPGLTRQLFDPGVSVLELADLAMGDEGLGVDSLALIDAAAGVSRFFGLGTTGRDDYLLMSGCLGDWADLVTDHLSEKGVLAEFVFQTSGSVDHPKSVTHRLEHLLDEVVIFSPTLFDPAPTRIVGMVPPHHIYGFLFTCLYPEIVPCAVEDVTRRPPGAVQRLLRPGDLIVGTPQNWASLLSDDTSIPAGVFGVVSAGPVPADLWDNARSAGLDRLVEVYGATETGGIGWRVSPFDPYRLLPHLERVGGGITGRCAGDVRKPQDCLAWEGDQRFTLQGRCDKAVQVAGVNVSLQRVRSELSVTYGVAEMAVRLDGSRLKAFLVPADPNMCPSALIEYVSNCARDLLPPPARPAHYTVGPVLPRNAMGKPTDWVVQGSVASDAVD